MEPITLCGLVIVAFGLWVEFEPVMMAVFKWIGKSRIIALVISQPPVQKPVYVR
jgi:hypothetical protein